MKSNSIAFGTSTAGYPTTAAPERRTLHIAANQIYEGSLDQPSLERQLDPGPEFRRQFRAIRFGRSHHQLPPVRSSLGAVQ
jgi:hypothetical protein